MRGGCTLNIASCKQCIVEQSRFEEYNNNRSSFKVDNETGRVRDTCIPDCEENTIIRER